MSSNRVVPVTAVYPFGLFSLGFVLLSIVLTTFLSHPENPPAILQITDYLRILGVVALILILFVFVFSPPDRTSFAQKQINPVGMYVAFGVGLGLLAIMVTISPSGNAFSSYLATFSSLQLDRNLMMFLVATIEELMFRVAFPMFVYIWFPGGTGRKLIAATLISTGLFAMWHWFAYNADLGAMAISFVAGLLLTAGYQLGGYRFQGGETAFIGIVAGHWLWNTSLVTGMEAVVMVFGFMFVMTIFILLVNRYALSWIVSTIARRRVKF